MRGLATDNSHMELSWLVLLAETCMVPEKMRKYHAIK